MNWLDMALIGILAVSIVASFAKGFTREVIGLVAAVAALLCGSWFYRMAGDVVRPWVGSREVANLCGFLLIVAAVIVLGWLVSLLVSKMMKAVGLSWLDRLLGLAFGVARGVIVCVTVITAIVAPSTDTRNAPTTSLQTRSLTTIMVVDIRDFTPLARKVSEDLLSQTIGTWFLRVGQVTQKMGSWAQKYVGDAVMAVWVHDDQSHLKSDLLRTLRAVNEINMATAEISNTLPLPAPLRIGAGVNTGPAIIGGTEYTALGDTVNAAFRLEKATKGIGLGVALGERTFQELALPISTPFVRREVELKGYEALSAAWAISFADLQNFLQGRE